MNNLDGSKIAKAGFANEKQIAEKFENWEIDKEAQEWLEIMGYNIDEIEYVHVEIIHGHKADIQVQITIKLKKIIEAQNIQIKLVSNKSGFNQIDKRWIDNYAEMWNMPVRIVTLLKYYTGEITPYKQDVRDSRRMYLDELSSGEQEEILNYFKENKTLIILDLIKGRGILSAEWILVAQKLDDVYRWILKPINVAINHYSEGEVVMTSRGNLKLGSIAMQRKGGDEGKPTANKLQFKVDPIDLFNV